MATDIGKLGVWSFIDNLDAAGAAAFARQLEDWGYGALWVPEAVGRDPFAIIAWMAAHTKKIVFCTGIANIYARDPMTMTSIRKTLGELAPGRIVLGLGVSHQHLVQKVRGHEYSNKPVSTMRSYLEGMEKALYMGPAPAEEPPVVLAALRSNMLKLSAEKAAGAHPYFVPPEHTAKARATMGPSAWLCPEQMEIYLGLPNYQNNLLELGFTAEDFANGGSDRIVDAIVAWGDDALIRERIAAHHAVGASHVCIQAFRTDGEMGADMALLERFAPARA
jgi:alkanesulfonate monooxygenase SsuD/methylene tetrahydromethanopterin reductase-like flavin-dependent oxidoreductase (luciferase family)